MKLFRYCFGLFVILVLFQACSSDDGPDEPQVDDFLIGTWRLAELNINPPQDIDMDGTPTANVLSELDCVAGTLTFSNDNTWGLSFDGVSVTTITNDLFIIQCTSNVTTSGTWQRQGNQVTLFRGFDAIFYTVNESNSTLTNTIGEDLPNFESEVYEKQ